MDSASLFLTANCDTVYFWGFVDLSDGPMVLDVPALGPPSGILGTIDDMWFRWVTDVGLPGPDRGAGGRYLIVGPGYDGPLPGQRLPCLPRAHHTGDRCSAGRSWSTTIPRSRSRRSGTVSVSPRTCPVRKARPSRRSSPGSAPLAHGP